MWEAEIEKKSIETENSTEIQFVEVQNINHEPEMRKTGIIIQKGGWRIELERDANIEYLKEEFNLAQKHLFGTSSEKNKVNISEETVYQLGFFFMNQKPMQML